MKRREFLLLPLSLLPSQEVSPPTELEPIESEELLSEVSDRDLIIQLAIIARAREYHLFNLLNLTRTRDMNIGTINWDGTLYSQEEIETVL